MGSVSPPPNQSGLLDGSAWRRRADGTLPVPGLAFKRTAPSALGSGPPSCRGPACWTVCRGCPRGAQASPPGTLCERSHRGPSSPAPCQIPARAPSLSGAEQKWPAQPRPNSPLSNNGVALGCCLGEMYSRPRLHRTHPLSP